uniref:Fibronectin type-III domain-containing protein n=1 Tax=Eptatretus burgeri TaxID=7764 RepID=A0A8C4N8J0_EPTBU
MVTTKCVTTSFKVTGLSEKLSYFFRILAENEYGIGAPHEAVDPVNPSEIPGPVKDLNMKDSTKTSVIIHWTKPEHDGGSLVTDYVVEKRVKGGDHWETAGTTKSHEFEVTNLKEMSFMEFQVFAKNEKGLSEGTVCGPIQVKDYIIEPEADLSDIPNKQIIVRIGNNMNVEIPYKGKPRPSMQWTKDNLPIKETDRVRVKKMESRINFSIKNVNKKDGGKYTLILDSGVSRKTFALTLITLGPPSKLKAPVNFAEIKSDSVIISWQAPEDDGGSEVTSYTVEKRESSQTQWKMVSASVARTTFKVPNLLKGAEYSFRICAENRLGVSEPLISTAVVAKHQFRVPGPPSRPVVFNITSDGMTITWDKPVYDGGAEITGYHVDRKERNSILWQRVNKHIISNREYRVTGLLEGLEYQFCVYAENSVGLGPASDPNKHVLAVSPVDPPGTPDYIDITRESVTLKWEAPLRDGGVKIVAYTVERRQSGGRWLRCNFTDVSKCLYTVTGLSSGDRYEFRVIARNAVGTISPPSQSSGYIVTRDESVPPKCGVS